MHGLFLLGSTSEAAYLTDRQRRYVVEAVVAHVGGQLPVLAGAIDMTTPRVLDHVAAVADAGAEAVVVTAPSLHAHPSRRDRAPTTALSRRRVTGPRGGLRPPRLRPHQLPADLVLELAAEGVLAGLKDSSGDLGGFRTVVTGARVHPDITGFSVLTGSELFVDSALALGADGAVPGLANVDPHGYVRLDALCRAGDWSRARAEQERLCSLFGLVGVGDPARDGRQFVGPRGVQGGAAAAGRDRVRGDCGAASRIVGG
ncbi:dihydrodipicolinate synthase family protein [Streptomyces sp. L7]